MGFDFCNRSLKIQKSIGTPTPKVGIHLEVWGNEPSHSPTLPGAWNVTHGLHIWPTPSQALALVANPSLRLQQPMWFYNFGIYHIDFNHVWELPRFRNLFSLSFITLIPPKIQLVEKDFEVGTIIF